MCILVREIGLLFSFFPSFIYFFLILFFLNSLSAANPVLSRQYSSRVWKTSWLCKKSLQPTLAEVVMSCPVLPREAVLPKALLSFSPSKTLLLACWGDPKTMGCDNWWLVVHEATGGLSATITSTRKMCMFRENLWAECICICVLDVQF